MDFARYVADILIVIVSLLLIGVSLCALVCVYALFFWLLTNRWILPFQKKKVSHE